MPASIQDVAKRANVSISTVSRVINRRDLVNEKTCERVEEAIRELGYRPNAFARGLMLRKSEMIGMVLPDLHGEFYSEIIRGADARARELNYNLVIFSAKDPDDSRHRLQNIHQRSIVDGVIIMVSEITDRIQETLADLRVPFVILDGQIKGISHDSIAIDQYEGAMAMMRHLVKDRNMRRIIFIGGLETNIDSIARLNAYRQILQESNMPYRPEDVIHLDYQYDTAYDCARANIANWVGQGNCVFAANDEMASGIIDAAAAEGFSVPDDIAVVGFDDTRIARMTRPPLTTVRVPMSEMGARALELLCERVDNPDRAPCHVSLQPRLVVRESCKQSGQCT